MQSQCARILSKRLLASGPETHVQPQKKVWCNDWAWRDKEISYLNKIEMSCTWRALISHLWQQSQRWFQTRDQYSQVYLIHCWSHVLNPLKRKTNTAPSSRKLHNFVILPRNHKITPVGVQYKRLATHTRQEDKTIKQTPRLEKSTILPESTKKITFFPLACILHVKLKRYASVIKLSI